MCSDSVRALIIQYSAIVECRTALTHGNCAARAPAVLLTNVVIVMLLHHLCCVRCMYEQLEKAVVDVCTRIDNFKVLGRSVVLQVCIYIFIIYIYTYQHH
jgi:hypothetical protein